jgi:hypothetical protein
MPAHSCSKCLKLWREYALATTIHVDLVEEQKHPHKFVARHTALQTAIVSAGLQRELARAAIEKHIITAHGEKKAGSGHGG